MLQQISQLAEPFGAIIGFLLTIMVLSYIIGDNILFRLAIHIFIGVATGYAAVIILYNVVWYQVLVPVIQIFTSSAIDGLGSYIIRVVPAVILGIWMLTKLSPRVSRWGTPVLAFLTGVGAATVVAGAVWGTIFPQVGATINLLDRQSALAEGTNLVGWFINGMIILVGIVATLIYFQFGIRRQEEGTPTQRPIILDYMSTLGQGFIVVTMGVLFTGVYLAALSALVDRVRYLWDIILSFI
jgi:glucan phosphoethanolaminetransferase (alkaline phosphatase superfamily)